MPIDLSKCHEICHECVKSYIKKHQLKKGDTFDIIGCKGIPKEYVPATILSSLGEDPETIRAMLSPVIWANKFLDWHCLDPDGEIWRRKHESGTLGGLPPYDPIRAASGKSIFHRPYQFSMLSCTSLRKVFRIGRQCLTESSLIQLSCGTIKSIKDIVIGDCLLSLDVSTGKQSINVVIDSWSSGKQPVYKIRTKFGHEIVCTNTHPFLSLRGNCDYSNGYTVEKLPKKWITIQDGLSIGDKIATPTSEEVFGVNILQDGLAELLGYFIADGSCTPKQSAKFTNTNEQYLQEFSTLCKRFGTKTKPYIKGNGFDLIITNGYQQYNPVRELIFKLGLGNLRGPEKRVPAVIFTTNKEQIRLFLNRMWAADGYISTFQRTGRDTYRTEIGILQENCLLLEDIQRLLWRFGVHGYIKPEGSNWRYVISNKFSIINFLTKIGPIFGKEIACDIAMKNIESVSDKYCKWQEDILWDYIQSIEYIGEEETYDIEVEGNHNFISNGIYTHNCGKSESLCIAILYNLFTNENFHVEIIAPYQSQIDLIFKRLSELINSNYVLTNSISRSVKAPQYTIELKNGSMAIGFSCVAGTKITCKDGIKNIEDITVQDVVLALDTDTETTKHLPVTEVFLPNYKNVFEVLLMNGKKVTVSSSHPFWTRYGWQPLKNLNEGDEVATCFDYKIHNSKYRIDIDPLGYLFGLILGDGNITECTLKDGGPRFTAGNPIVQQRFEMALVHFDIPFRSQIHNRTGSKEYTIYKRYPRTKDNPGISTFTPLTELIYKYNLQGSTSKTKYIPIELINSSNAFKAGILQGFLETDGSLSKTGVITFHTVSEKLAYNIGDLLSSFGILHRIRKRKQAGKDIPIKTEQRVIHCNYDIYEVAITSKYHANNFMNLIDCSAKTNYQECLDVVKNVSKTPAADTLQFSKIRKITYKGKETTYDIAVGNGTNNFIANGIILHNTAGVSSKQEAGAARGQHANMLVFDESDMLSPKDIDAALAVIINHPEATVWMSSTPTGKREKFYESAHNPQYKEFHFPSSVNPNWTPEIEAYFKSELTHDGYEHEILANFSEQEEGVYQLKYVEAAQSDYEYKDMKPSASWSYMVGVDWNDIKIGTTVAVIGFNSQDNVFYLVDKYILARAERTQLSACQKIAEINRLWNASFIYIDAGYGAVQEEILHDYGARCLVTHGPNHPDSRLRNIVKSYDFGSSIEVRDPFTKLPVKKPAKPFLVENSVRRFETLQFRYPKSDKHYTDQLLGYIIDRVSITGRPVYKAQNEVVGDHFLDAVNLALVAFTLEKSHFGKATYMYNIAIGGRFGETESSSNNKYIEEAKRTRPKMDRAEVLKGNDRIIQPANGSIPASNTNYETMVKPWRWEGFSTDGPKPETRSLRQAFREAGNRLLGSGRARNRPQRKKF